MYTCSISELEHRVRRLENEGTGGLPIDLQDKDIVVPGDYVEEVDIDIP